MSMTEKMEVPSMMITEDQGAAMSASSPLVRGPASLLFFIVIDRDFNLHTSTSNAVLATVVISDT